jgi:exodeoxyribonuclease-3
VNSLRARLTIFLEWIKTVSPDVLCLQETKVPDSDFPQEELEKLNFQVVYRGEKTFNGVAILSRVACEDIHYGFEDGSEATRLISAKIKGIAPEPKDVYDPELLRGHVGFHPDEHAVLLKFKEWGFIDVFRRHNSESGQYSFWDYTIRNAVKKGMGWRIDHIWATKVIAEKSTKSWIDVSPRLLPKPSDHTPVVAEFKIQGG